MGVGAALDKCPGPFPTWLLRVEGTAGLLYQLERVLQHPCPSWLRSAFPPLGPSPGLGAVCFGFSKPELVEGAGTLEPAGLGLKSNSNPADSLAV